MESWKETFQTSLGFISLHFRYFGTRKIKMNVALKAEIKRWLMSFVLSQISKLIERTTNKHILEQSTSYMWQLARRLITSLLMKKTVRISRWNMHSCNTLKTDRTCQKWYTDRHINWSVSRNGLWFCFVLFYSCPAGSKVNCNISSGHALCTFWASLPDTDTTSVVLD